MPSLSKLRPTFGRTATKDVTAASDTIEVTAQSNDGELEGQTDNIAEWKAQQPNEDAQRGVRMVEGITLTWSKGSLIWIFIK
jgi:hypothetical protein